MTGRVLPRQAACRVRASIQRPLLTFACEFRSRFYASRYLRSSSQYIFGHPSSMCCAWSSARASVIQHEFRFPAFDLQLESDYRVSALGPVNRHRGDPRRSRTGLARMPRRPCRAVCRVGAKQIFSFFFFFFFGRETANDTVSSIHFLSAAAVRIPGARTSTNPRSGLPVNPSVARAASS